MSFEIFKEEKPTIWVVYDKRRLRIHSIHVFNEGYFIDKIAEMKDVPRELAKAFLDVFTDMLWGTCDTCKKIWLVMWKDVTNFLMKHVKETYEEM